MKQPAKPSRVLAVVGLAVFLSILDLFIVNIAFPDLRRDFEGSSLSGLSWVLTAYAIVYAAVLVPAGRLGDLYGRRLLFVIGLALFTLGSALCALAPSLELLIAARVLQGIGAAALTPNSLGLVLPLFPAEKRSSVIGAWAGIGAVGASVAPPLGGLLVEVSWRLIFIVNVPLGLIAIVLALRLAPEVRDARATRLPDVPGIAVLVAAVGLLTLGLTQGTHWGWDERVLGAFLAAAVLGAVFLRRCARHPAPVVELALLRVPAFALAGLSTLLFSAGFAGLLLGNVLFFTEVWDYSVLKAGLAFAPGPLLAATTAIVSGRLADGRQPAAFGAVGGFVFAAGCLWFITQAGAHPAYLTAILPGQVLTGIGVGLLLPSFTATAAATLAPEQLATGIGVQTMCRQIGAALGLAAWVAIVGTPSPADAVDAFASGWLFMAVTAVLAGLALLPMARGRLVHTLAV
ncbi:MAG TPA: MFS transporter [Solirubrobacteraceae bacterium]|nr:MFS transporter [Solirubrobacteraceae bacterium]